MSTVASFVATIAKQGELRVVIIPKKYRPKLKNYEGEHVKITIEEIIPQQE